MAWAFACTPEIRAAVPPDDAADTTSTQLLRCALDNTGSSAPSEPWNGALTRSTALETISAGYAAAKHYHRAVDVACSLQIPTGIPSLQAVGVALARDGRIDEATRLAVAIEASPRPPPSAYPSPPSQIIPPDPFEVSAIWAAIAVAHTKRGDPAGAKSAANKSRGYAGRNVELEIHDELLRRGDAAGARALLDEASERAEPEAIGELARRHARAGRREQAAALLRRGITRLTGVGKWYPEVRRDLVVELARLGYFDESIRLSHGDDEAKPGLIKALIEADQLDLAQAVAQSFSPDGRGVVPSWRADALAALAAKHHKLGRTAEEEGFWRAARQAADAQPHPGLRVQALLSLGSRSYEAGLAARARGLFDDALALAASMPEADREGAMRHVTTTYARLGQCERALEIAATIGGTGYAIREIAAECTNAGDLERIEARIGAIQYDDRRAEALTDLAVKYGRAGRTTQALSAIGRIGDRNTKARALGALAAVIPSGDGSAPATCP